MTVLPSWLRAILPLSRTGLPPSTGDFQWAGPPRMDLDAAIDILLRVHTREPGCRTVDVMTIMHGATPSSIFEGGPGIGTDDYTKAWVTLWNYRELRRHG